MTKYKVIKISAINNTSEITGPVFNNIDFQPDEMILRSFFYDGDVVANSAYQLWSDLIDDGILICFGGGGSNSISISTHPDLHFDMKNKKISGTTFTFQVQDITNGNTIGNTTINAIGAWGMMLEFRKYGK